MDLELTDRVVLVTGANRGIGRAIAESAVAEGAIVAVVGREQAAGAETVRALGEDRASWWTCDVTDEDQVRRMVDQVAERHGRLDAVVNNAGRFGGSPIAELSAAALREGLDTKVVGALGVVQAFAQRRRRQLGDRAAAEPAGVIDHRVQATVTLRNLIDHLPDLIRIGHIARPPTGTLFAQGPHGLGAGGLVAPDHGHDRAFRHSRLRDRPADAPVGACHQDDPVLELKIHASLAGPRAHAVARSRKRHCMARRLAARDSTLTRSAVCLAAWRESAH